MRKKPPEPKDVISPHTDDNETWYHCPICDKTWKSEIPEIHALYRIKTCKSCLDIAHGSKK